MFMGALSCWWPKTFGTKCALKRLLSSVNPQMYCQWILFPEPVPAHVTHIVLFITMDKHMLFQAWIFQKNLNSLPLWIFSSWSWRSSFVWNLRAQALYRYCGFTSVWMWRVRWLRRFHLLRKSLWQVGHSSKFFLVWMFIGLLRVDYFMKPFSQMLHVNGFLSVPSGLWIFLWEVKLLRRRNF